MECELEYALPKCFGSLSQTQTPHSVDDLLNDNPLQPNAVHSKLQQHHRSLSDTFSPDPQDVASLVREYLQAKSAAELESEVEDQQLRRTLVHEIHEKYCSEQGLCSDSVGTPVFISKVSPSRVLPGKRGAGGCLGLLVINDRGVSCAGDLTALAELVQNITELDLACNSLSDWTQVATILCHMPRLMHCNLSQNPLNSRLEAWLNSVSLRLERMNSLVLNATAVPWPSLFELIKCMPNLEELHLSLNDYSTQESLPSSEAAECFPGVHILHLNGCSLRSWDSLLRIAALFPCLESLVAANNPVSSIGSQDLEKVERELRESLGCLHSLNINRWQLGSWEDVERLRLLPLLCELRMYHVPLLETLADDEKRDMVIARLPDVTMLNGSVVGPEHRENAERRFLRAFLDAEEKPKRYWELESIHGKLEPLAEVDLSPKCSASVFLVFEDKQETRHISLVQTVGQFKKSLQSFCGLTPGKFRLFYVDHELIAMQSGLAPGKIRLFYADQQEQMAVHGWEELRFPRLTLQSLKVADGDQFHIQAKPEPPPRRRTHSSQSGAKQ